MITVMMFIVVFIILGVGLVLLIRSQTQSTDMERTDVKAFNVAEAGVDAGMLSLKLEWPSREIQVATVQDDLLKQALQTGTKGLWDPTRSDISEFIQVALYDNVDTTQTDAEGRYVTTAVADADAPKWDYNGDGMMFVDSNANVGDDRHRILILAQRQDWRLTFAPAMALWASSVDSNGGGLTVSIEKGDPPVYYDVHDVQHKGVTTGAGVYPSPSATSWDQVFTEAQRHALEMIARGQGTYFEDGATGTGAQQANAWIREQEDNDVQIKGLVIYVKSSQAVVLTGNQLIGTEDEPVVVVIDTPDGLINGWDSRGTCDLYGVLVNLGHCELRGTCAVHGAVYCHGTVSNKGTGSSHEINYNQEVINNLNSQYVINVNIVPNTWEEYTLPRQTGTTPSS